MRNIYTCLVHENPECVSDLVKNLQYYDPDSAILLYNGGKDEDFLSPWKTNPVPGVHVHATPRQQYKYRLYGYMLDCMLFCGEMLDVDILTHVDSDQLLIRPGYSKMLTETFKQNTNAGCLSSQPLPSLDEVRDTIERGFKGVNYGFGVMRTFMREIDKWEPILARYPGRDPQWSFWPGTSITMQAAWEMLRIYYSDEVLRDTIHDAHIFASEELFIPTLACFAGFDVVKNPSNLTYCNAHQAFTLDDLEKAVQTPNAHWIHKVPCKLNDPLRTRIRALGKDYQSTPSALAEMRKVFVVPEAIVDSSGKSLHRSWWQKMWTAMRRGVRNIAGRFHIGREKSHVAGS